MENKDTDMPEIKDTVEEQGKEPIEGTPCVPIGAESAEEMAGSEERKPHRLHGFSFFQGFLLGALSSAAIFCGCYYYVHKNDVKVISYNQAGRTETAAANASESGASSDTDSQTSVINDESIQKLQLLESTIDTYYLDADKVDSDTLEDGMYAGMLESLGDPYSVYYTVDELNDLMDSTQGVYYGIGAYIAADSDTGLPVISGVITGAPAEEAGLRAGDICYKVDGESTEGMELEDFVSKVKGEEGTTVTLTILREGEDDYMDIEVERRQVESPTVNYEMKEGNIGYIQITEFDSVTTDQFADALATLKGQGMKGLVIDLRNNPGGSLTTVCDIAEQLLPEGTIVYTVDRNGKREDYNSDGKNEFSLPMAVLVNQYSASASEILSGAIKDYKLGTLIGTTTYGKGIVQRVIPFSDGTAVKLTVSKYYTPNGVNIQGTGIDPDLKLEFDSDAYKKDGTDNQLDKALEIVSGGISG